MVFGCPPVPPTPAAYPPTDSPFAITFNARAGSDPIWVGLVGPFGDRNTVVVDIDIHVDKTGSLYGSITKVHRWLRDRDSGEILGERTDSGPFRERGGTPCRGYDPLLLYGGQNLSTTGLAGDPLGFKRRPAMFSVDVTIVDTAGGTWTVSKSVLWQLVPFPTPRSPVRTTVRQNDPESGCVFDSVHGYGTLLDFAWDAPVGGPGPIAHNGVILTDATGRLFGWPVAGGETSLRVALCNTHFDSVPNRGPTWAIFVCFNGCLLETDFVLAAFDFQSCRDAGVPACQPGFTPSAVVAAASRAH
jgi:hypothetical protein